MHTGLLWYDNDPRTTLSVKIQKAMDYYSKKFGRNPDLCLVHPSMMDAGKGQVELGKLVVRAVGKYSNRTPKMGLAEPE